MVYGPTVPPVTAAQAVQVRQPGLAAAASRLATAGGSPERVSTGRTAASGYCGVERLDGPRVHGACPIVCPDESRRSSPHGALPGSAHFSSSALFTPLRGFTRVDRPSCRSAIPERPNGYPTPTRN